MFKSKSHASALSTTAETLQSNLSQLNLGSGYALFGAEDRSDHNNAGSGAPWLGVSVRSTSNLHLASLHTHDEDDETTEGGDSISGGSDPLDVGGGSGGMSRSRSLHSALASRGHAAVGGGRRSVVFDQFDNRVGAVGSPKRNAPHRSMSETSVASSQQSSASATAQRTRAEAEHKQFTRMVHSQLQTLTVQVVSHHRRAAAAAASGPSSPASAEQRQPGAAVDSATVATSLTGQATTANKSVDPALALLMVRVTFAARSWTIRRTTRAFEHLHHAVLSSHSFSPEQLPALPQKLSCSSDDQGTSEDDNDDARRDAYNKYLTGLLQLENVWRCPAIPAFLDNDQDKSGASDPHELSFKCELLRVRERVWLLERNAQTSIARETALSHKVRQQGVALTDIQAAVRRLEQQQQQQQRRLSSSMTSSVAANRHSSTTDLRRVASVEGFQIGMAYETDGFGMRAAPPQSDVSRASNSDQRHTTQRNHSQPVAPSNGSLATSTWAKVSGLRADAALCHRANALVDMVRPSQAAEDHRRKVFFFVHGMLKRALGAQAYPIGPAPLRCYVPDEELTVSAFVCHGQEGKWFIRVSEALYALASNDHSGGGSKASGSPHSSPAMRASSEGGGAGAATDQLLSDCAVSMVSFDARVIRCVVDDLKVKICANDLGSLAQSPFFEEFDRAIDAEKRNNSNGSIRTTPCMHLFKRSLLLIKTWAVYEGGREGSLLACVSEPALCVLVTYLFNLHHSRIDSPLEALVAFFLTFEQMDWSRFVVTVSGILPVGQALSERAPQCDNTVCDQVLKRFNEWESTNADNRRGAASLQADGGGRNNSAATSGSGAFITVIDPVDGKTNLCADATEAQQVSLVALLRAGAAKVSRLLSHDGYEDGDGADRVQLASSSSSSAGIDTFSELFKSSTQRFEAQWRPDVDGTGAQAAITEGLRPSPSGSPLLLHQHIDSRPGSPLIDMQAPPPSIRKVASFPANINDSLEYLGVHGSSNALAAAAAMGHVNSIKARGDGIGRSTNSLATLDRAMRSAENPLRSMEAARRNDNRLTSLHRPSSQSRLAVDESSEDLLQGNLAEMWSRLQYCSLLLDSQVTSPALLALATEILADKGPLPVGEVGKMLQEATSNPQISAILKEQFGGLKKFIEMHPGTFVISTDHPFNPKVFLLASLTPAQVASIKSGDMSAVIPTGKKSKNRRRKAANKNNSDQHNNHTNGNGANAKGGLAMVGESMSMQQQASWQQDKHRMHAAAQYHHNPQQQQPHFGQQQQQQQQQRHYDGRTQQHQSQQSQSQSQYQQHPQEQQYQQQGHMAHQARGGGGGNADGYHVLDSRNNEAFQQQRMVAGPGNNQYGPPPPASGMQYRQPQQMQRQFHTTSLAQTQDFAPISQAAPQTSLNGGGAGGVGGPMGGGPPGLPPPSSSVAKGIRGSASMVDLSRHSDRQLRQQQQQPHGGRGGGAQHNHPPRQQQNY